MSGAGLRGVAGLSPKVGTPGKNFSASSQAAPWGLLDTMATRQPCRVSRSSSSGTPG